MSSIHMQEMSLFRQLAAAIGESLKDVCNMQEKERQELITVLGLVVVEEEENEEYLDRYLGDNPGSEGRKYRSRTITMREENYMKINDNQDLLELVKTREVLVGRKEFWKYWVVLLVI